MAKQKGLIGLTGTIGGVTFYYRKGKPVARLAGGGFNGDAIKQSPKMARVRENGSEFGKVSKAKKLVRLGLYPFLRDYKDVTLHGRMMTLFQQIKVLDTLSARGQRLFENGLATDEGKNLFLRFDFTTQKASAMLPGAGQFDVGAQQYRITGIAPEKIRLPKGATGMHLCFGILRADFAQETYELYSSPTLLLDTAFTDPSITLTPTALPSGDGVRIAVLQVRYYQEVNGTPLLLHDLEAQALEVVGVY